MRLSSCMAVLLEPFAKLTYSGELAGDSDDLSDHFDVFVIAELDSAMELLGVWVDHQRAVLEAAAGAQVLPIALQKQVYRLFPKGL